MASIKDTIVLITGASSGIGAACAQTFAAEGAHLILAAWRGERIRATGEQLRTEFGIETLPLTLDVRDQAAVAQIFGNLPELGHIDILLNNAGLSRGLDKLHEGLISDWDEMIDTNVKGLLYVTRGAAGDGRARPRPRDQHRLDCRARALPRRQRVLRQQSGRGDAQQDATAGSARHGMRVTSVEPGLVETEFSLVRYHGDEQRASQTISGPPAPHRGGHRGRDPLAATRPGMSMSKTSSCSQLRRRPRRWRTVRDACCVMRDA